MIWKYENLKIIFKAYTSRLFYKHPKSSLMKICGTFFENYCIYAWIRSEISADKKCYKSNNWRYFLNLILNIERQEVHFFFFEKISFQIVLLFNFRKDVATLQDTSYHMLLSSKTDRTLYNISYGFFHILRYDIVQRVTVKIVPFNPLSVSFGLKSRY